MKKVLFISTKNYMRSRLAEYLFNYIATKNKIPVSAFSRGFQVEMAQEEDKVSEIVLEYLNQVGVALTDPPASPQPLIGADFIVADEVVVLNEEEHLPMMEKYFSYRIEQSTFWSFPKIENEQHQSMLPWLDKKIRQYLFTLTGQVGLQQG